jgi:methylthioribulose-1-phosphate dehydratase
MSTSPVRTDTEAREEQTARGLVCELLRLFYEKEWVTGTGGGISCMVPGRGLLLAPTGVHKERVRPDDLFLVEPTGDGVIERPADPALRPSECHAIFSAVIRQRGAGSVLHSHALSAVLAADRATDDTLSISRFEMLKGIAGTRNDETHLVPVIANTPREHQLSDQVEAALADPRFARSACVMVRDHGAYIWGRDIWEAKRHAEVYHFLYEGLTRRTP